MCILLTVKRKRKEELEYFSQGIRDTVCSTRTERKAVKTEDDWNSPNAIENCAFPFPFLSRIEIV